MSRNDGFTLIEVMIATAIIGILLAIALPQYQDYTARTQVTSAIQSVGGIKADLLSYMYDSGACTGTDPYYTPESVNCFGRTCPAPTLIVFLEAPS